MTARSAREPFRARTRIFTRELEFARAYRTCERPFARRLLTSRNLDREISRETLYAEGSRRVERD